MMVRIDNREQKRALRAQDILENLDCNCTIEQLDVGDYVFNDSVCFEYKTVPDMCSSISERRVHNQALDQSEKYPYHFVLIVGTQQDLSHQLSVLYRQGVQFNLDMWYGEIARLNTFTTVVQVENENKALYFMELQARKCLDGKVLHKELMVKKANPAFNFLITSTKGIGEKTTNRIVEELGVESLKDLMNLTTDDLCSVSGVGVKTAENILRSVGV